MIINYIKEQLSVLNPIILEVTNESELHRAHSGYKDGNSHFKIIIISDEFINLPRIERHKIIYKILENELKNQIHALKITAKTIQEYEKDS